MYITASDFSKVTRGSMPPDPLALAGLGLRPSFCRLYASWLVARNIPECVKHVLPVWQAEPCQPEVQLQAPLVVLHDAPFLQLQLKAHPGPNLPAWQAMREKHTNASDVKNSIAIRTYHLVFICARTTEVVFEPHLSLKWCSSHTCQPNPLHNRSK